MGWTVRGSNAVAGEIFRTRPDRPWGQRASYTMVAGSFLGIKRPGREVNHPPPSSAGVKERAELYFCPPFFAFMAVYRRDFKSTFLCRPSLRVIVEPPVSGRMQIDGRINGRRFHLAVTLDKTSISQANLNLLIALPFNLCV